MNSRERVLAALQHSVPDRVPRFEIWIDALLGELGCDDPADIYVHLGQDCVMIPSQAPAGSNAWRDGVDEWGRIWQGGTYVDGAVDTRTDLERYSPSLDTVEQYLKEGQVRAVRERHPDHCLIYGTHVGPFTAGFMAMGFERFFTRLYEDPGYVRELLAHRTEWCIALYREALRLGAEVLILGDDGAHRGGPMVSPQMWRELVLPCHRQIVSALEAPVIWHSDGDISSLLPMALEAGFVGVHGLEPAAGMDLRQVKRTYGDELVLVGNIDVAVLCGGDLEAVRAEVRRCRADGAPGGGYMIATCNSIFKGMNPVMVAEMYRCERETDC